MFNWWSSTSNQKWTLDTSVHSGGPTPWVPLWKGQHLLFWLCPVQCHASWTCCLSVGPGSLFDVLCRLVEQFPPNVAWPLQWECPGDGEGLFHATLPTWCRPDLQMAVNRTLSLEQRLEWTLYSWLWSMHQLDVVPPILWDYCPTEPTFTMMHSRELLTRCRYSTRLSKMPDVGPKTCPQCSEERWGDWTFSSLLSSCEPQRSTDCPRWCLRASE